MTIYDYTCVQCGKPFEMKHKITEVLPESVRCPVCEGNSFRVIRPAMFLIKGGYMNKQFIDHTTRPASEP